MTSRFFSVLPFILCAALAITLQMQITLFSSDTYLGLRVNLTDILLPAAGLFVLISLLLKQSRMPEWPVRHFYPYLAGLVAVLAYALLHTYLSYGYVTSWAYGNKFIGFFVPVALLGLGGWIGTNSNENALRKFIHIFVISALTLLFLQALILTLQALPIFQDLKNYNKFIRFPIEGFMANRNAYMFLMCCVYAFVLALHGKNRVLHAHLLKIAFFLLPFLVVFNGSRTGGFVLLVMIVASMILDRKNLRQCFGILVPFILGAACIAAVFHGKWQQELPLIHPYMYDIAIKAQENTDKNIPEVADTLTNPGDKMRLQIIDVAVDIIKDHPLIGGGLGSSFLEQKRVYGKEVNVIDSTPLWLLTETGLIGLAVFAAFYIVVVRALFINRAVSDDDTRPLYNAFLLMILAFSIMCVLHEILYTRHIWFFIGLGLCLKPRTHQAV